MPAQNLSRVARQLRRSGQVEEARRLVAEARDRHPQDFGLLLEAAEIAEVQDETGLAEGLWLAATRHPGSDSKARVFTRLARLRHRLDDLAGSEEAVTRGLEIYPDFSPLIILRAAELARSGRWLAALDYLEETVRSGIDIGRIGTNLLNTYRIRSGQIPASTDKVGIDREIALLAEMFAPLKGKDCIAFGSAPGPTFLEPPDDGRPIICSNAAGATLLRDFARTPDYTILAAHIFSRDTEAAIKRKDLIRQAPCLGRVLIDEDVPADMAQIAAGLKCLSIERFSWDYRFLLQRLVLDVPTPQISISTGAFSVLCACFAGARSVELVGFSLSDNGHSHENGGGYRNHVASDAALFSMLSLRRFDLRSSDLVIQSICRTILR